MAWRHNKKTSLFLTSKGIVKRVSRSKFIYDFQVSPGEKIIRLHFYHSSYNKGFRKSLDLIDVEAGRFTLLSNFSASLTAEALGVKSLVKEFCMNVEENQLLRLIISPAISPANDNAYAFINGIEIISVPVALSYFRERDHVRVQAVGRKSNAFYVDRDTALENIYRWNTKTELYFASRNKNDLLSMWAAKQDNSKTKNDTFRVSADVGFNYLIRLHFSEIALKMAARDQLIFKVFIGETFAQSNTDLLRETEDNGMKWYRDYLVTTLRGHKNNGKSHLLISVESYDDFIDGSGILEGFEILKLTNPDHSLASPNPLPSQPSDPFIMKIINYMLSFLDYKDAFVAIITAILVVASIVVCELHEISEANIVEEKNKPSERAQRICRRFSLDEIRQATNCYSNDLLIGKGGFGRVYKGIIDGGQETVAVKKLKLDSRQGAHEFLTEIETLSELRHINLVPLISYCNEYGEMMLVYKYMPGGTLDDHLYKKSRKVNKDYSVLTWKQRLNICIGAARGLDYLHTGHGIIHRDVKSSNILLDENLEAKVSDFGLAKPEDRSKSQSHVSTNVKGTPGYWDPHYCVTRKLTRKSDTYAFGVVLFEVLCGRPAVDSTLPEDERVLIRWVQEKIIYKEDINQIVDPSLREETISPDSLKTFVEDAERCINGEPKKRPTMSQVVLQLEIALELHEGKLTTVPYETQNNSDDNHPLNDGTDLSTIEEVVKPTSSNEQSLTSPPQEQTTEIKTDGFKLTSGEKYEKRGKTNKPSRPWGALWNNALQVFARLEERRVKRRDTKEWMRHRQLPPDLRERVRRFVQYNWLSTRGVNEEDILQSLPHDLRREIQKHLCLDLVRRVPFFSQMDNLLLDAVCERLVSSLNTKGTYIVREGDPVNEMLFIIRAQLESSMTDGGRLGFFNSITLKPGDFCGEELLTWALVSSASNANLPASTRTVKCIIEVEAFALRIDDLKFFANQFKRLHSKKLQQAFRYYSHQWRTWGACIIQAAWRRHKRKKVTDELMKNEGLYYIQHEHEIGHVYDDDNDGNVLGATVLASKFVANTKGAVQKVRVFESEMPKKLFKPDELSFGDGDA